MSLSKKMTMSTYDIIYTKTYALAQIPHTCAGPSASLGLSAQVLRYLCSGISRNRADTIHL